VRQAIAAAAFAAFVVACLRLGWWQWQRYRAPGGSLQNLGYTLQWPTFALFALFALWRLRRLERQHRQRPPAPPGPPPPVPSRPVAAATDDASIDDASADDDDADDELAAYNRYLAQLNAKEQHRGR
jgi:hypothetical protein